MLAEQLRKFLPPAHLLVLTFSTESTTDQLPGCQLESRVGKKEAEKAKFSLKSVELPRQLIKSTVLTETAHCKQQPNKAASS